MRKSIAATFAVAFPLLVKSTRMKTYVCIAIVLSVGCTATQVRWDATNIRKEVMVYYNDQIMDNLIRAKNKLPFVHVDINLLTSTGGSQISGAIGAGETQTHTDSGPIGALNTLSKAVTRPFSYSVTPQQTETLTISAAPALGSQAMASPAPEPEPSKPPACSPSEETKKTIEWDETKKTIETETTSADGKIKTWSKTESTKKPPKLNPRTIYDLYQDFAGVYVKEGIPPSKDDVLPGTVIKWCGTKCYYIDKNAKDAKCKNAKDAYYDFCKALFTKGQGQTGSLEKALQQTQAQSAAGLR
jgi:hypothetical protein